MISIKRSAEPTILKNENKTSSLKRNYTRYQSDYDSGLRKFKFDNKTYGDDSVKETLKTMQHDKCCFCESKITHIDHGDVEHFRPKGRYKQKDGDTFSSIGYYWLAYDWNNLLLSCTKCNQTHKRDLFPLLDETKRAKNHHDDIENETPLLINPTEKDPEQYISFCEEFPFSINNNEEGKTTIDVLGLKRDELNKQRFERLEYFKSLLDIIELAKEINTDSAKRKADNAFYKIYELINPQAEYSAMIKAALSKTLQ